MICHDPPDPRKNEAMKEAVEGEEGKREGEKGNEEGKNSGGLATIRPPVPCNELISSIVRHVLNEKPRRYMRARRGVIARTTLYGRYVPRVKLRYRAKLTRFNSPRLTRRLRFVRCRALFPRRVQ